MGSGALVPRMYSAFRGVDFRSDEADFARSPDAVNMWKDYRSANSLCTRPAVEPVMNFNDDIHGLFFYTINGKVLMLVHCGESLYKVENGEKTEIYNGLQRARSQSFINGSILYIKDGAKYLQYNGTTVTEVVGYIPTTAIGGRPSTDDFPGGGSTPHEDVNLLSQYRKNTFIGDGVSNKFYLDTTPDHLPISIKVNGVSFDVSKVTIDYANAVVVFNEDIPPAPYTDGQDNVEITFGKLNTAPREKIDKCTLLQVFDNRVFFSGNPDFPNMVWHSSLENPTYVSDLDYYIEGLDLSPVRSMVAGNDALWVFKEPSQANTTVFYHKPALDENYGKIYPSEHSSIATGCVGAGINFNDDIVFFSDRGMEGISGDITTEQVLGHRSTLVDRKLLSEKNYKDMILAEWQGYLLVIIDDKIYLADSRGMTTIENHMEYEWFYWETGQPITCATVKGQDLYLGSKGQVCRMRFDDTDRTEVVFTEVNGDYVLYGESKQNSAPTIDDPAEIVNTYKAGRYKAKINGIWYLFDLDDDLRSTATIRDEVRLSQYFGFQISRSIFAETLAALPETGWTKSEYWTSDGQYAGKGWFTRDYETSANKTNPIFSSHFKHSDEVWTENGIGIAQMPDGSGEALWVGVSGKYLYQGEFLKKLPDIEIYFAGYGSGASGLPHCIDSSDSHWTTPLDKFDHPHYLKTSNKRGCTVEAKGDITVHAKTNRTEWEHINDFKNVLDYFVCRIKRKKFKDIQLKFSSTNKFSLESATLECFVGGYIKR